MLGRATCKAFILRPEAATKADAVAIALVRITSQLHGSPVPHILTSSPPGPGRRSAADAAWSHKCATVRRPPHSVAASTAVPALLAPTGHRLVTPPRVPRAYLSSSASSVALKECRSAPRPLPGRSARHSTWSRREQRGHFSVWGGPRMTSVIRWPAMKRYRVAQATPPLPGPCREFPLMRSGGRSSLIACRRIILTPPRGHPGHGSASSNRGRRLTGLASCAAAAAVGLPWSGPRTSCTAESPPVRCALGPSHSPSGSNGSDPHPLLDRLDALGAAAGFPLRGCRGSEIVGEPDMGLERIISGGQTGASLRLTDRIKVSKSRSLAPLVVHPLTEAVRHFSAAPTHLM